MKYLIVVACGDKITNRRIVGVNEILIAEGIYRLFDCTGTLIFSAPADSVVYLELDLS